MDLRPTRTMIRHAADHLRNGATALEQEDFDDALRHLKEAPIDARHAYKELLKAVEGDR